MRQFFSKKYTLSPGQTACLLLFSPAVILLILGFMNPSLSTSLWFFHQVLFSPLLGILNYLPILAVTLLIFFLTKRAVFSVLLSGLLFGILGYVNLIKLMFRAEPLIPSDFRLMREALGALTGMGGYDFGYSLIAIVAVVILVPVLFIAWKKWEPAKLSGLRRILLAVLIVAGSITVFPPVYAQSDLIASFSYPFGGKDAAYGGRGFVYSFLHDVANLRTHPPEGYNRALMHEKNNTRDPVVSPEMRPHVIMVMSEAHSDISDRGPFDFTGHRDPLEIFRQVSEEAVIAGHLALDTSGGGTAWGEFSSLSGIAPLLVSGINAPYDYVRWGVDALPRRFAAHGYFPEAIHPGYSWFYNRQNAWRHMGFEKLFFIEDSFAYNPDIRPRLIEDSVLFDFMLDRIDQHLDTRDEPLFQFITTIYGHGGYVQKFQEELQPAIFNTDLELSDRHIDILTNYFLGVIEADIALGRLVDHVRDSDEPFVIVFFSDHMPFLHDNNVLFTEMGIARRGGSDQDLFNFFRLPYFIWANDAALRDGSIQDNFQNSTLDPSVDYSVHFLPGMLLELLGLDEAPFIRQLNEMRADLPVIQRYFYQETGGELVASRDQLSERAQQLMHLYHQFSYYLLFDDQTYR